ncbi:transposase [Roseomonas chloroacetimidivorans]|uniref:transposase n=1 Tax=Roseomonas chloroacetimidivorans TaxID=1766656 RepID=UPI003C76A73A
MVEEATGSGRPRRRYRMRNWREYDMALVARGDLAVWISPDLDWHAGKGTGRRGRPQVFTDAAIQTALTLKVLYQPPLRAAQGMVGGLIRLAGLDWRVPRYSTLSRRQKDLAGC